MTKQTVLFFFFLLFSFQLSSQTNVPVGTPVCRDTINLFNQHGESFKVIPNGDSRLHWLATEEGYIITQSKGVYYFGKLENKQIVATNISLSSKNISSQKQILETIKQTNFATLPAQTDKSKSVKTIGGVPSDGKIRIPVLLVEFSDQTHTRSKENVEAMFMQDAHNNYASLREYYLRASHNKLEIQFDVFGWYQSNLKLEEVSENKGGKYAGQLVKKAIELADKEGVDFSPYDNDNDGDVDAVVVMHAGLGADHYGQEKYIWPRSWSLQYTVGLPVSLDEVKVNDYVIACEMREYDNKWVEAGLGTFAHEFGHALGLPDLYDGTGKSNGLGHWAIMSAGSWLSRGVKPANFCAWSRIKLGWDQPTTIRYDEYGNYSIYSSNTTKDEIYRINTSRDGEYFLLANKRKEGNDIAQAASGLAIYHINDAKANLHYEVNDDRDNPGVRFVEADFNTSLGLYNAQDRGTASDLFPGVKENHEFGPYTSPSSNLFNGIESKVWIKDIQDENGVIKFSLNQVTGIKSLDKISGISVYPNPVHEHLNIKANSKILSNAILEIYNLTGSKLYETELNSFQSEKQINLQSLANGVYIMKIITEDDIYSKKILKY